MGSTEILGDLVRIQKDMADADFWVQATGENKGKPSLTQIPDSLGVKVVRTDRLVPKYLYYVFEHLSTSGAFFSVEKLTPETLRNIEMQPQ